MEKITWKELTDYLYNNHNGKGVVVIKNNPTWKKEYPEKERSYLVHGDNNYFNPEKISTSIWADALEGTDKGVRLDWYIFDTNKEERWQIDYCYIVE